MKRRTFWQWAKIIPPILARLIARVPYSRPLTDEEIAARGGMSVDDVRWIMWQTSWDHVGLALMEKFLRGCDVDICGGEKVMKRVREYLPKPNRSSPKRNPTWKHLRISQEYDSKYKALLCRYYESIRSTLNPK